MIVCKLKLEKEMLVVLKCSHHVLDRALYSRYTHGYMFGFVQSNDIKFPHTWDQFIMYCEICKNWMAGLIDSKTQSTIGHLNVILDTHLQSLFLDIHIPWSTRPTLIRSTRLKTDIVNPSLSNSVFCLMDLAVIS